MRQRQHEMLKSYLFANGLRFAICLLLSPRLDAFVCRRISKRILHVVSIGVQLVAVSACVVTLGPAVLSAACAYHVETSRA